MNILAMEYQGYGLYSGTVGSESLLDDSLYIFDYLTQKLGVS